MAAGAGMEPLCAIRAMHAVNNCHTLQPLHGATAMWNNFPIFDFCVVTIMLKNDPEDTCQMKISYVCVIERD